MTKKIQNSKNSSNYERETFFWGTPTRERSGRVKMGSRGFRRVLVIRFKILKLNLKKIKIVNGVPKKQFFNMIHIPNALQSIYVHINQGIIIQTFTLTVFCTHLQGVDETIRLDEMSWISWMS